MSDTTAHRRIRAQASANDASVVAFVLDDPIQANGSTRFDAADDAPPARALFAVPGVRRVEVSGPTVWVKKSTDKDWADLKPAIAAAIRRVLDETGSPLGCDRAREKIDPDATLLQAVKTLLDQQVNPSVAVHGGHISVDRVRDSTVYLRMSGGCQGCAASSATLRQGVEKMLRAALPGIGNIVDVTDHASGRNPFYACSGGSSPILNRPIPPDVIGWEDGQIVVDPDYLAPRLGLTPEALRDGLHSGNVVGVTETGEGADEGKIRVVLRCRDRAWAAELDATGAAREIPPPRLIAAAAGEEQDLSDRVRAHLEGLAKDQT